MHSVFCLPEPSADSLQTVYTSHLSTAFSVNKFTDALLKNIPNIVSCVIFMLQEVTRHLKHSPNRPLFTFCIRDLSKVRQMYVLPTEIFLCDTFVGFLKTRAHKPQKY